VLYGTPIPICTSSLIFNFLNKKPMRTTSLFTSILCLILIAFGSVAHAQATYLKEVIIANGSDFSNPDPATVGAYNPVANTYTLFDSIAVQSVQDIVVEDSFAYLAAESVIIKYNLNTHSRVDTIVYAGILSLSIIDDYLAAGKYYGTTPFVTFYDKNTLDSLFSIDSINNAVRGVVLKDSLYVPYNVVGSDFFSDTLGLLAVVDLSTHTVARIVALDTAGVGASSVFAYGNDIFVIADGSGSLIQYHPATGSFDQYKIGISAIGNSKWFTLQGEILYAEMDGKIGTYNMATHQVVNGNIIDLNAITSPSYFIVAAAYDTINEQFYLNYSDFSSEGYSLVYDITGARIDSFHTGVANEAIALYYAPIPTGVANIAAGIDLQIFPNPAINILHITFEAIGTVQLSLKDLSGRSVMERSISSNGVYQEQLSLANLANGLYLLRITNGTESYTSKVIKL
jgi:hypothetical protein